MKETKNSDTPVFKGTIEADVLKKLIKTITVIANDCRITITPKGISLSAMDEAHIAMINLHVVEDAFIEYEAKSLEIGLNLQGLNSIVSLANPTDVITLEYDKPQKQLIIQLGDLEKIMNILDPVNLTKANIPYIDLPAKIKIEAGKLQNGFFASKAIADSVLLSISPDSFEMVANGEIEKVVLSVQKDGLIEHDSSTLQQSQYSVDYLTEITQIFPAKDTVQIVLGENLPLQMEYSFAEEKGYLTYMQAPRIEDDAQGSSDEPLLPTDEDDQ